VASSDSLPKVKTVLDRNGLFADALPVDIGTLRTRLSEAADAAHVLVLAMRYIGISSIPVDERRTLDRYKRVADEFNEIGVRANTIGVRFTSHNHGSLIGLDRAGRTDRWLPASRTIDPISTRITRNTRPFSLSIRSSVLAAGCRSHRNGSSQPGWKSIGPNLSTIGPCCNPVSRRSRLSH
jgi:hypothetical protein